MGLLVDRTGFPLEIGCFEGAKAETHTIIPVIKTFQDRHGVTDMVVAADAGMLLAKNLKELDDAGLRFIVGSRQTKAPHDLATHFRWNGEYTENGQIIDTITPKGVKRLDPERVKKRREPVWSAEEHRGSIRLGQNLIGLSKSLRDVLVQMCREGAFGSTCGLNIQSSETGCP